MNTASASPMRHEDRIDARIRRGMTLIELVVVLVILSTLGTVIVTSMAGLANGARHQQSVRTLDSIRDAIVGQGRGDGSDPAAALAGFIADVGRLPQAGSSLDLSELWDREATSSPPPALSNQVVVGDSDLRFAAGWSGPYVRLPIGGAAARDGWGRNFLLRRTDGGPVTAPTDFIGAVRTLGADNAAGGTGVYDQDLETIIVDSSAATPIDLASGDVSVQLIFNVPVGEYAIVRLFGPVNGTAQVVAQSMTFAGTGSTASASIAFDDVPIGPKLIRAYRVPSPIPPPLNEDLATAAERSPARRVVIPSGGVNLPDIALGVVD